MNDQSNLNAWADRFSGELKTIALKYGEAVMNITLDLGAANHAVEIIARRNSGNREQSQAIMVIAGVMDKLARTVLADHKWLDQMVACKGEIDALAARQIIVPEKSGIIVAN